MRRKVLILGSSLTLAKIDFSNHNNHNTKMNILLSEPTKAELFTSLFKDLKIFTNEINLMFEKGRFYIQSMDSAHVLLFEITLSSQWFTNYTLISNNVVVGINTQLLYQCLYVREKNQSLEMNYIIDKGDQLFLRFESTSETEYKKSLELPLMDISSELMSIPEFEENVSFTIDSTNFSKTINELATFGDKIEFRCNENGIAFISKNTSQQTKMKVDIDLEQVSSYSIDEGLSLELCFSAKYLQQICKFGKMSKNISLYIHKSFPMKIIYSLGSDSNETLVFYLAPMIDDDE
jgi:proliferating cell nuclear antigen PCNA